MIDFTDLYVQRLTRPVSNENEPQRDLGVFGKVLLTETVTEMNFSWEIVDLHEVRLIQKTQVEE